MTTASERFAALNKATAANPKLWNIANNGSGQRIWFLRRHTDTPWPDYHKNKRGELIRYSFEGALTKAEQLNSKEGN
jgi:hypothetical protein